MFKLRQLQRKMIRVGTIRRVWTTAVGDEQLLQFVVIYSSEIDLAQIICNVILLSACCVLEITCL